MGAPTSPAVSRVAKSPIMFVFAHPPLATYPSERAFHHPPPRQWLEPRWEHHSLELVIGSDDEPTARQVRLTS